MPVCKHAYTDSHLTRNKGNLLSTHQVIKVVTYNLSILSQFNRIIKYNLCILLQCYLKTSTAPLT